MVIARGENEGDPRNRHRGRHEIKNTGRALLRTINFYVPPACSRSGEPLPRGRR